MKKPRAGNESRGFMPSRDDAMATARRQSEALLQAQADLLGRLEEMQKSWFDQARTAMESAGDLAARAARCSSPAEAAQLYSEWLNERMDSFFSESRRLSEAWMRLYDGAAAAVQGDRTTASEPASVEMAPQRTRIGV